MLYMVIERFKSGNPDAVGTRFKAQGRLMPEGSGLVYVSSWMAADGGSCYQIMEAPSRESFNGWTANWADLVDFEIVPVMVSAEFWASRRD
jgi:hypothetical protein